MYLHARAGQPDGAIGSRIGLAAGLRHPRTSYHCQPMARELTDQRMFDWLDEHIYA